MNFGINIDAGNVLAELRSSYAGFKETKVFNEAEYKKLLEQYAEAIKAIELLKLKIEELEKEKSENKMPTKDEVESMSAALNFINNLDPDTVDKLQELSDKFGKAKGSNE